MCKHCPFLNLIHKYTIGLGSSFMGSILILLFSINVAKNTWALVLDFYICFNLIGPDNFGTGSMFLSFFHHILGKNSSNRACKLQPQRPTGVNAYLFSSKCKRIFVDSFKLFKSFLPFKKKKKTVQKFQDTGVSILPFWRPLIL